MFQSQTKCSSLPNAWENQILKGAIINEPDYSIKKTQSSTLIITPLNKRMLGKIFYSAMMVLIRLNGMAWLWISWVIIVRKIILVMLKKSDTVKLNELKFGAKQNESQGNHQVNFFSQFFLSLPLFFFFLLSFFLFFFGKMQAPVPTKLLNIQLKMDSPQEETPQSMNADCAKLGNTFFSLRNTSSFKNQSESCAYLVTLKFRSIKVTTLLNFATAFLFLFLYEGNWFFLKIRQKVRVFMRFLFLFWSSVKKIGSPLRFYLL